MARRFGRTAQSLFEYLDGQGPSFEGLIRGASAEGRIEFSLGLTGSDWIEIQVSELDDVASLGRHEVGGETHRAVRLRLRAPAAGPATVYARLAGAPVMPMAFEAFAAQAATTDASVPRSTGWCLDSRTGEWYRCPPYREA